MFYQIATLEKDENRIKSSHLLLHNMDNETFARFLRHIAGDKCFSNFILSEVNFLGEITRMSFVVYLIQQNVA